MEVFRQKLGQVCVGQIGIQELREKRERLRLASNRLRADVENAKASKRNINEEGVETLLTKTNKSIEDARTLEQNIQDHQKSSFSRLNLNRKSRLISEIASLEQEMLHLERCFDTDEAVLVVRWESDFPTDFIPSRSFGSALYGVVNALNSESTDPSVIAVCGPRGAGKTSLAIHVEKKARDLLKFQVVRLVLSQSTTTEEVQDKLAAFLGLSLQNIGAEERADRLRLELRAKPRILILDNVCTGIFNLASIGIPNNVNCKVLVTASDDQVFRSCSIITSKVIKLGHLDHAEAWELLEKNLTLDASPGTKQVAKRIAEELDHSTVSIITLGTALRREDHFEWTKAYTNLKSGLEEGENENIKIVYRCVKLSYGYLTDLEVKRCFLLCSLFPGDYPIAVEDLKRCAWGLQIYRGADTVESADKIENVAKKVDEAIKTLTKSFLLLEQGETHVRMTNVIRDAALLIASKDEFLRIKSPVGSWERLKHENLDSSYTAISYLASHQEELQPVEFLGYNLRLLFLGGNSFKICGDFCRRLTFLEVVAIHHGELSLNALQNLGSVKALHLEHCKLDGLSSLRELKILEILSFRGSDISELPDEVGELKYLILLDLSDCQKLQRIPLHLIRRLSRLEELYFTGRSFVRWWSKEREQDGFVTSDSMIRFLSRFATESFENQGSSNESRALKVSALLENESMRLDRDCVLVVQNHVLPNLVQSVEKVKVQNCDNFREVFQNGRILHAGEDMSGAPLSDLTSLELEYVYQLSSLVSISDRQTLQNLITLKLDHCFDLQSLFSMTLAQSLDLLENLEIHGCKELKKIIADETTDAVDVDPLSFPKLKRLKISNCVQLQEVVSFEVTEQNIAPVDPPYSQRLIKLPELQQLEVEECPNLSENAMFQLIGNGELKEFQLSKMRNELCESIFDYEGGCLLSCLEILRLHDLYELQGIWNVSAQMITFQKLVHLEVVKCNKLKNLFSLLLARNLLALKKLVVRNCDELVQLVERDKNISSSSSGFRPVYFPNLEELLIFDCEKLKFLFPVSMACLPSLKKLVVRRANLLMEIFKDEAEAKGKTGKLQFLKWETLQLEDLISLETFVPVGYCCEFPNLKSLQVICCPSFRTRFETTESASDHTVYTKTNNQNQDQRKLRRSVTVVDIPTRRGDIVWSPDMKIDRNIYPERSRPTGTNVASTSKDKGKAIVIG